MKMRKGAPLLFALATLLSMVPVASASHCGAVSYACCDGCGDAQGCFSACQQQNRVCYKLVYDTVMEKRWHTCYKTVVIRSPSKSPKPATATNAKRASVNAMSPRTRT